MKRRLIVTGVVATALASAAAPAGATDLFKQGLDALNRMGGNPIVGDESGLGAGLSQVEIGKGLRQALEVASGTVVNQLGRTDGFYKDAAAHIPLPGPLDKGKQALALLGEAGVLDDLELRMNRAAEAAVPKARDLFLDAIEQMTIEDARQILTGPQDAATRYFQRQMTPALKRDFTPVVDSELADVGALELYDEAVSGLSSLPVAPDARGSLTDFVVEKALDGVFHYFAQEEAAIRSNPAKRTTDLLKKVFG